MSDKLFWWVGAVTVCSLGICGAAFALLWIADWTLTYVLKTLGAYAVILEAGRKIIADRARAKRIAEIEK